eukprot:gene39540-52145_t
MWVFEYPTIESMAIHIESWLSSMNKEDIIQDMIPPPSTVMESPLSPLQLSMYLDLQMRQAVNPDEILYQIPSVLVLSEHIDLDRLYKSWLEVLGRQSLLRCTIEENADGVVHLREHSLSERWASSRPEVKFSLEKNVYGWQELVINENWLDDLELAQNHRLSLSEGSLVRVTVLVGSTPDYDPGYAYSGIMVVVVHHLVADGTTLPILFNDWRQAYLQSPSPLPHTGYRYMDMALYHDRDERKVLIESSLEYWRGYLGVGSDYVMALPSKSSISRSEKHVPLKGEWTGTNYSQIISWCKQQHCTPFQGVLFWWMTYLSRVCQQSTVVVGIPTAHLYLDRPEWSGLVGLFVNTVVLRLDIDEGKSWREQLRDMLRCWNDVQRHGQVTMAELVADLKPQRMEGSGSSAFFRVMFNYISQIETEFSSQRNDSSDKILFFEPHIEDSTVLSPHQSLFDWEMTLTESSESFVWNLAYKSDLFDSNSMCDWGNRWESWVSQWLMDVDRPDLCTTEDISLLESWSTGSCDFIGTDLPRAIDLVRSHVSDR